MNPFTVQDLALKTFTAVPNPQKFKELIKNNFATIYKSADTEKFMQREALKDVEDSISRKNQYVLKTICERHPGVAEELIDMFANNTKEFGKDSDQSKILSDVSQALFLMKANPYNDKKLQLQTIEKIIDWNNSKKNENIRLLHRGLNFHIDTNTLNELTGNNPNKEHEASTYLSLIEKGDQNQKNNCTLLNGIVGITVVITALRSTELAKDFLSGISNKFMEVAPELANQVIPALAGHKDQFILAGLGFIAAMTFNKIAKSADAFTEAQRSNNIRFVSPDKVDNDTFKSLCSERLLGKMIHLDNLDVQNESNQKYIALNVFLNEKLHNLDIKMSKEMIEKFKFSDKELEKINSLNMNDLHEISMVKVPQIRYAISTDPNMSEKTKMTLKKISALSEGMDIKYDKKFAFSELGAHINSSQHPEMFKDISKLSKENKVVLNSLLDVLDNHGSIHSKTFMKNLNKLLQNNSDDPNKAVSEFVSNHISKMQQEETAKEVNNHLWHYTKKICKMVTGQEKISQANYLIKESVSRISKEFDLPSAEKVNDVHPTIIGRIKMTNDTVLSKIQQLRDMGTDFVKNRISPT